MGLCIRLKRLELEPEALFPGDRVRSQRPAKGQAIEGIGLYDPLAKDKPVRIDTAKVEMWRSRGAALSPSVARLLKRVPAPPQA